MSRSRSRTHGPSLLVALILIVTLSTGPGQRALLGVSNWAGRALATSLTHRLLHPAPPSSTAPTRTNQPHR